MAGCLVIPHPVVPEEDQYADDRISFIKPGLTGREEVNESYGLPQLSRADGHIVVYAQARTVGGIMVGTIGAAGAGPIESFNSLVIEYDENGTVIDVDVIRGADGCTEDGLCIAAEFHTQYSSSFWFDFESALSTAILFTSDDRDERAKSYAPGSEGCAAYLYNTGKKATYKIYRPGVGTTPLNERGYLFWTPAPGEFDVYATSEGKTARSWFTCTATELMFINVNLDTSRKRKLEPLINVL
jgi:hypothetical protein